LSWLAVPGPERDAQSQHRCRFGGGPCQNRRSGLTLSTVWVMKCCEAWLVDSDHTLHYTTPRQSNKHMCTAVDYKPCLLQLYDAAWTAAPAAGPAEPQQAAPSGAQPGHASRLMLLLFGWACGAT
jgi:hypothetical protein